MPPQVLLLDKALDNHFISRIWNGWRLWHLKIFIDIYINKYHIFFSERHPQNTKQASIDDGCLQPLIPSGNLKIIVALLKHNEICGTTWFVLLKKLFTRSKNVRRLFRIFLSISKDYFEQCKVRAYWREVQLTFATGFGIGCLGISEIGHAGTTELSFLIVQEEIRMLTGKDWPDFLPVDFALFRMN